MPASSRQRPGTQETDCSGESQPKQGCMCVTEGALEVQGSNATEDSMCAICLSSIEFAEIASPDCCDHQYCACCILQWSLQKEKVWCPQCKLPFSCLLTYRTLDGQLHDYPCKESVSLLQRCQWFTDYVKAREAAIAAGKPGSERRIAEGSVIEEGDFLDYNSFYQEFDDDEEIENFYFSAAAGRARIVIGNRRLGPNGYLSSGRMQARPAQPSCHPKARSKGKQDGREGPAPSALQGKPAANRLAAQPKAGGRLPAPAEMFRGSAEEQSPAPRGKSPKCGRSADKGGAASAAGSPGKQAMGRRARRNQRKAAADARAGL